MKATGGLVLGAKRARDAVPGVRIGVDRKPFESERGEAVERATRVRRTVFGWHPLVLTLEREEGPYRHLDLLSVLQVTKRWRDAILSYSNGLSERAREILSGHVSAGTPLEGPHLAFLPLASVGRPKADGRLRGWALALPADVAPDVRREALQAVASVRYLALGRLGKWRVVPEPTQSPRRNLRPEAWTAYPDGATHWSTVTPVVFDRHPKSHRRERHQGEVAAMLRKSCARIGLPQPREVIATAVSAHLGAPPSFAFPMLRRKDGTEQRHTHAILVFDEPVCGPVLVGAGRYRGYGFCRPLEGETTGTGEGDQGRGGDERVRMAPR